MSEVGEMNELNSEAETVNSAVAAETSKIAAILSKAKGAHIVDSTQFSADAIVEVASQLNAQNLLDNYTVDNAGNSLDYEGGTLILAEIPVAPVDGVAQASRYRLAIIPGVEQLLAYPEIKTFLGKLALTSARRNVHNVDASPAIFASPVSTLLPKVSEASYNKLATALISGLQAKYAAAFRNFDRQTLKDCLKSSVAAHATAPTIKDLVWDKMLDKMIAIAEEKGLDSLIFRIWKEGRHRYTAPTTVIEDIDFEQVAQGAADYEAKRAERAKHTTAE